MRRLGIGSCAVLAGICGLASAAERPAGRTISVSGTVETKTAPDQVVWNISLMELDKNLQAAKTRSDEKVKAVIGLREKLGLGETDLQTGLVSVSREYEREPQGGRGAFKHFLVQRSLTIRQRDLRRFDEFLDTLLGSADMEVSFGFESTRLTEVRKQARLQALQVAREKAAAMAQALDAKLGPVVTIEEPQSHSPWNAGFANSIVMESRPPADVASDRFVPGSLAVTVTIHVTFELLP